MNDSEASESTKLISLPKTSPNAAQSLFSRSASLRLCLIIGSVFYGINGGIFFIFSVCVMPSLASLPSDVGILTMQRINDVILNPFFFIVFFGALFLSFLGPLLLHAQNTTNTKTSTNEVCDEENQDENNNNNNNNEYEKKWKKSYVFIASALYAFGCIIVTITANVPRNDALKAFTDVESSTEATDYWQNEFLTKWVFWNHFRTICCILASIFAALAI